MCVECALWFWLATANTIKPYSIGGQFIVHEVVGYDKIDIQLAIKISKKFCFISFILSN